MAGRDSLPTLPPIPPIQPVSRAGGGEGVCSQPDPGAPPVDPENPFRATATQAAQQELLLQAVENKRRYYALPIAEKARLLQARASRIRISDLRREDLAEMGTLHPTVVAPRPACGGALAGPLTASALQGDALAEGARAAEAGTLLPPSLRPTRREGMRQFLARQKDILRVKMTMTMKEQEIAALGAALDARARRIDAEEQRLNRLDATLDGVLRTADSGIVESTKQADLVATRLEQCARRLDELHTALLSLLHEVARQADVLELNVRARDFIEGAASLGMRRAAVQAIQDERQRVLDDIMALAAARPYSPGGAGDADPVALLRDPDVIRAAMVYCSFRRPAAASASGPSPAPAEAAGAGTGAADPGASGGCAGIQIDFNFTEFYESVQEDLPVSIVVSEPVTDKLQRDMARPVRSAAGVSCGHSAPLRRASAGGADAGVLGRDNIRSPALTPVSVPVPGPSGGQRRGLAASGASASAADPAQDIDVSDLAGCSGGADARLNPDPDPESDPSPDAAADAARPAAQRRAEFLLRTTFERLPVERVDGVDKTVRRAVLLLRATAAPAVRLPYASAEEFLDTLQRLEDSNLIRAAHLQDFSAVLDQARAAARRDAFDAGRAEQRLRASCGELAARIDALRALLAEKGRRSVETAVDSIDGELDLLHQGIYQAGIRTRSVSREDANLESSLILGAMEVQLDATLADLQAVPLERYQDARRRLNKRRRDVSRDAKQQEQARAAAARTARQALREQRLGLQAAGAGRPVMGRSYGGAPKRPTAAQKALAEKLQREVVTTAEDQDFYSALT